jgi:AraC-like DNA-binding protein
MFIKPQALTSYDGYTVGIGYARVLLDFIEQRGHAAQDICTPQQFSEIRQAPPSARFSVDDWHALMASAESLLQDPCLALTLSEHQKPWNTGLVGFMSMTSNTLREVGQVLSRYHHLLNDLESAHEQCQDDRFVLGVRPLTPLIDPRITLLTIGTWAWHARVLTGKPDLVFDARFGFPSPGKEDQFARVFGGTTLFNQTDNALMGSAHYLDLPVLQQEPSVNRILHQQAEQQVDQRAMSAGSFLARLENMLALQMGEHEVTLVALANALDMSPRTVQTRLETMGLSFRGVVERVRKNLALKYLNDSRLSLLEIALMLGFTNQTSFHHAFKRWTGQSPGEFRRHLLGL